MVRLALTRITASHFTLETVKPTEGDRKKYSNTEELRGCRQINDLKIETLTFKPRGLCLFVARLLNSVKRYCSRIYADLKVMPLVSVQMGNAVL